MSLLRDVRTSSQPQQLRRSARIHAVQATQIISRKRALDTPELPSTKRQRLSPLEAPSAKQPLHVLDTCLGIPSTKRARHPPDTFLELSPSKKRLRSALSIANTEQPSDEPFGQPAKRARLSKQNLEAHDRMGKNGARYAASANSEKSISTTSRGFEDQAYTNGILPEASSAKPANLDYLKKRLNQERASASPTEADFNNYVHNMSRANNEAGVKSTFSRRIVQPYEDDHEYSTGEDVAFLSFPQNLGFNDGLSPAQPDFIQGVEAPQFPPQIHSKLGGVIKPYPGPYTPTLAQLAGEFKGPGKDLRQAQFQAAYDGTCLVFARNKALELLNNLDSPNHAIVQTFVTDGTTLITFAHYANMNSRGVAQYHHVTTSRTILINSPEEYNVGYRRQRNMQDIARGFGQSLRDQLIAYDSSSAEDSMIPAESTEEARDIQVATSNVNEVSFEHDVPISPPHSTTEKRQRDSSGRERRKRQRI